MQHEREEPDQREGEPMLPEPSLPTTAKKNVETIAQVEKQLLRQRSPMERIGEAIARFFGSLNFIVAHVFFIAGWIALNTGTFTRMQSFDPYPFTFLSFIVGIEFIFLTTFVLLNQKYQMRRAEQWSHLHLQLSMLTEQEVTKSMQMLDMICQRLRLGVSGQDQELKEMAQVTSVTALVDEIGKVRDLGQVLANETGEPGKGAKQ
jgi:uncharacterized membrane protein